MDGAAILTVIVSTMAVLLSGAESTARTCYFGPPPKPDPSNLDNWKKQVLQNIRGGCPERRLCILAEERPTEPGLTTVDCSTPRPLGMEDKTIPDRSISASSTWGSSYPARKARLNGAGMWAADSGDANAWIEVDLGESTEVNGVVTQGKDAWYVTNYKVAYQEQPSSERVHVAGESGNAKDLSQSQKTRSFVLLRVSNADVAVEIFIGNSNGNTPVTNMFNERVDAVTVRIEPTGWQRGVALRLELLGCRR